MMASARSVTSAQIEALLDFLDEHRDLARGRLRSVEGKVQARKLWEELRNILNSMGGCTKTVQQWQKVWFDRKHLCKRAAANFRMSASATGGSPSLSPKFSPWELKVLSIMGDRTADLTDSLKLYKPEPRKMGRRPGVSHQTISAQNTLPITSSARTEPNGCRTSKRERPDDTASPITLQEDSKRAKVHTAQEGQRNYARATRDIPARLAVAICFSPPSRDLTYDEGEHIKTDLENRLIDSDPATPLPAFRGFPRIAEGTVQMWCEDDDSLTWLTLNVPKIRLPDSDLTLTVMRQSDVPTRVRAALFVPRYIGDIERLQGVLKRQNPWYDIGGWSLYRATSVVGDNPGTYLTLGLPSVEAEKVLGRERRLAYLLGSIYVLFYPKAEPSDASTGSQTTMTAPTTTQTDDIAELDEEMSKAAMAYAEADVPPPEPSEWSEQRLLASSPSNDRRGMELRDELSDGSSS